MAESIVPQQQAQTCQNLHDSALTTLDIKDAVDQGDFARADKMLAKLEEAVSFTRIAVQGMQLLQEAQDI